MSAAAAAITVALGFVLAVVSGAALIRLLARWQFRQTTYELAPESHRSKSGTPTMGGIVFIVALLPLLALKAPFARDLFFFVLACALVGFVDDYLSIRHGKNLGLRARTKFLLTALIAASLMRQLSESAFIFPRDVILNGSGWALSVPHWAWLLLGIVAVTGAIHAVNLTDGLDGLATGVTIPPAAALSVLAVQFGQPASANAALLMIGACLGFLTFNRHPAKMMMGDTGSLALGALLSGVAILTGEMLLLVLVGGVFVAEALSVIVQVAYFKRTHGKRIFRMSPLHHHFELGGLPETTVTSRFWIASALCSAVGIAIVR